MLNSHMTIASTHTNACFDAWIQCEELLTRLAEKGIRVSKQITKTLDECALVCMGTFHALKSGSLHITRMALLCVGICEECAEVCESLNSDDFRKCAHICRTCSDTMSALAFTNNQ